MLKIGDLAARAGCPVETVRYYEQAGLLPPATRNANNYRVYGGVQVERLRLIRACRELDMSLDEIRVLLNTFDSPESSCAPIDEAIAAHLAHVRARLTELRSLERQLSTLASRCTGDGESATCEIVRSLKGAEFLRSGRNVDGRLSTDASTNAGSHSARKGVHKRVQGS